MRDGSRLLGIAKKSGTLIIGADSVGAAVRSGKARVILSAADASDRSKRQAQALTVSGNILHVIMPFMKYELGALLGRGAPGMMAITDIGIASAFLSALAGQNAAEYGDAATILEKKAQRALQRKKAQKQGDTRMRRTKI